MAVPKTLSFALSLLVWADVAAARMPDTTGPATSPTQAAPTPNLDPTQDFAGAAVYQGVLIAASQGGGLVRVEAGELVPIELGLSAAQRQISAVMVYDEEVWLGTAAGLLRVIVTSCGHRVDTVLPQPVRAMGHAPGVDGITMARFPLSTVGS